MITETSQNLTHARNSGQRYLVSNLVKIERTLNFYFHDRRYLQISVGIRRYYVHRYVQLQSHTGKQAATEDSDRKGLIPGGL